MAGEEKEAVVKEAASKEAITEKKKGCQIKNCKRPYRAKGYCTVHYKKWRQGELPKGRFKTCNFGVKKLKHGEKKECYKKIFRAGLCEAHYQAAKKKGPAGAAEKPAEKPAEKAAE